MYLGEVDHADRYHGLNQPERRQLAAVSIRLSRKTLTGNRKRKALPAADLHRLHVKVRPQDVDVGVQVEGSGGLTLPRLPHLNTPHGLLVTLIHQSKEENTSCDS